MGKQKGSKELQWGCGCLVERALILRTFLHPGNKLAEGRVAESRVTESRAAENRVAESGVTWE